VGAYATSAISFSLKSKSGLAVFGMIPETSLRRAFPKEERTTKITKKNEGRTKSEKRNAFPKAVKTVAAGL
jgi:hypothetical protein